MRPLNRLLRWLLIGLAAGASFFIGAQWLAPRSTTDDLALAMPVQGAAQRSAAPASAPSVTVERDPTLAPVQRQNVVPASGGVAFAPLNWLPPPKPQRVVPPPPPPPPPEPVAPPLPFTYIGLLEQGMGVTKPEAFLARGDALLVVATGDTIENIYTIDSITAQQITLTYLPLKTRQTLNVSGAPR